jgi:hypothetical protein
MGIPGLNNNHIIQALISAAVKLKLRRQIKASFLLGWAIPIALTGRALPGPYDQLFFGTGAVLAMLGVLVLLVVQFRSPQSPANRPDYRFLTSPELGINLP